MTIKTSYRSIEGLVPLDSNENDFITISNNKLGTISENDLFKNLCIKSLQPFSINGCSEDFLYTNGNKIEGKTITVNPMKIKDSTNTVEIEIKSPIVKIIDGLFVEGNNQGCKDDSYSYFVQPIFNSSENDLGSIIQTTDGEVNDAYHLMDGIKHIEADSELSNSSSWLTSKLPSTVKFSSVIPFRTKSIILVNTNTETNAYLDVKIDSYNKTLVEKYSCMSDTNYANFINIDDTEETTELSLTLSVLSRPYENAIGFNEMIINAETRYIQPNQVYGLFVIASKDLQKVDILVSSNEEPILPEGYEYYAHIEYIKTEYNHINFESSYGNTLYFNNSLLTTITNAQNKTVQLKDIQPIVFESNDNHLPINYTIYLKLNGETYKREQSYLKCVDSLPNNIEEGAVVSVIEGYQFNAYEYKNGKWVEFNDVPVGEITFQFNRIIKIRQFHCNNNFFVKSIDKDYIWKKGILYATRQTIEFEHNLNIEPIKYNCDCIAVCVSPSLGYNVGSTAQIRSPMKPYLTKNKIGLRNDSIKVIDNNTKEETSLESSKWQLVFRIWR